MLTTNQNILIAKEIILWNAALLDDKVSYNTVPESQKNENCCQAASL